MTHTKHKWWHIQNIHDDTYKTYMMTHTKHTWWHIQNIHDDTYKTYVMSHKRHTWSIIQSIHDNKNNMLIHTLHNDHYIYMHSLTIFIYVYCLCNSIINSFILKYHHFASSLAYLTFWPDTASVLSGTLGF